MFLDGSINCFGCKAHRSDVESITVYQFRRISFHQRDSCVQRIRHIHHIHQCSFRNRTDKLLSFYGRVVDVYCVVSRTTSRRCHIRNDSRETHGTCIYAILIKIIVAQQLRGYLADTIHSARTLNGILRCLHVRCAFAKRTDRTRSKHGAFVFAGHFEYIP